MNDHADRLAGYVEVADRLAEFFRRFPGGSVQSDPPELLQVGESRFVLVRARAFREPDDVRPGIGSSWLEVPGKNPFTRGSEVENAETSAIGRALVCVGIPAHRIASADELRAKGAGQTAAEPGSAPQRRAAQPARGRSAQSAPPLATDAQRKKIGALITELSHLEPRDWPQWARERAGVASRKDLTREQASRLIDDLGAELARLRANNPEQEDRER